jgi:hypothetical protein
MLVRHQCSLSFKISFIEYNKQIQHYRFKKKTVRGSREKEEEKVKNGEKRKMEE